MFFGPGTIETTNDIPNEEHPFTRKSSHALYNAYYKDMIPRNEETQLPVKKKIWIA